MIPVKNESESKMLKLLVEPTVSQEAIKDLVQEYSAARVKDCMMRSEFRKALDTPNGHFYLKTLKE